MTWSTDVSTDILMVTHRRASYVRRTLPHLLENTPGNARVWLWHNGDDDETLGVVTEHLSHPRVHRFHHSLANVGLLAPTNWLWREAEGAFVAKVDDDCLLPSGWVDELAGAHLDHPGFGVIGSWRFPDEEYDPRAERKIASFPGGHRVLKNVWVQGSGYLMRRSVANDLGRLRPDETFTAFCFRVARSGLTNGWYVPFIREEHLDDPRHPLTMLRSDADLLENLPLSARRNGVRTLAAWQAQLRRSALLCQTAPYDPSAPGLSRRLRRGLRRRAGRVLTGRVRW